jgi:hypothetical protein
VYDAAQTKIQTLAGRAGRVGPSNNSPVHFQLSPIYPVTYHDFAKFAENCAEDERAIAALGAELEGSDRPLLVTGGLALLAPGRMAHEEDVPAADFPRKSEAAAAALA